MMPVIIISLNRLYNQKNFFNTTMCKIDAIQEAAKSAIAAKAQLDQRIAENKENWDRTSNTVKDIWTQLCLPNRTFRVGQVSFSCGAKGITNESDASRTPRVLAELQGQIKDYLESTKASYDAQMQL
jgi:hypothetical protein